VLSGTLTSHLVDMADLGGFIGSQPGRVTTPGQSPQQVEDVKRAEADPQLLPTRRISIPKIRSTDIHISYRGDKILGKDMRSTRSRPRSTSTTAASGLPRCALASAAAT